MNHIFAATAVTALINFGAPIGVLTQESLINGTDTRLSNVLFQVRETQNQESYITNNPPTAAQTVEGTDTQLPNVLHQVGATLASPR